MTQPRLIRLVILLALLAALTLTPARAAARAVLPAAVGGPADASIPLDRPLRFERFSLVDGLSQNSVLTMLQDRQGYLWFGTQDGLNRYNGYEFTVFKNDPDDKDTLSYSGVVSLLQDRSGAIWAGTWGGGLNRLDPATGRFTRYRHDPEDPDSLSNDIILTLYEDSQGRLWVGTNGGGLDLFDPAGGKFIHHTHDPERADSLSSDNISAILEDPSGELWVGTGGFGTPGSGLNRFDPATGKALVYRSAPDDPRTLGSDTISAILRGPDGALWISTGAYAVPGGGLNRFDPASGGVVRYQNQPDDPKSLGGNDILGLFLDPSGVLWIALYGAGLDRLDLTRLGPAGSDAEFVHSRNDPYNAESLSSDQTWSLLMDRSGVMWVGTVNGGLNKLNPQVQRFGLYRNEPGNDNSLSFNVIGPMAEDGNGGIWIATYGGGLNYYQPSTGKFTRHPDPEQPGVPVMSLLIDSRGDFWVGMLTGLIRFDPITGERKRYTHDPANPSSLGHDSASALAEDAQGRLWVGTLSGLDVFDRARDAFIHVKIPDLGGVVTLYRGRDDSLWVGSWGTGLLRLDTSTYQDGVVTFERYLNDPENPRSLSDNSIWAIHEDSAGALWVGTSSGLNRLDSSAGGFRRYRAKDGLPNENVLCILEEGPYLWISTNDGLVRFDRESEEMRVFDVKDGMQSNEFDSGACLKTSRGEMLFGGVNGLNLFKPAEIQDNAAPPPVAISTFRIFNEPVATDLADGTPIRLSYRQNFISFEFAALDFHAPQKNRYMYRLEGFDRDWVEAETRRYTSYTNLAGGDYVFRVRAANNDGVWNTEGISIPIHIEPPFYATWWFAGLIGVFVLAIIGAAVRWRFELVRSQTRKLEAEVDERTGALREANALLEIEVEQRKRAEEALALKAERELRESEARFEAMFANAAIGIGLMGLNREIIEANDAAGRLLGYNREEFSQIQIDDLIHPDDRGQDAPQFQELVEGKRGSYQAEKRYRHKNGEYIWARLIFSAVSGEDGKPDYLIGMLEDIGEQKRVQQELEKREEEYLRQLERRVWERTTELRQANEKLHQEIEQRTRVEAALAQKAAEEAVSAERNRLARDLHDAVTQTLFSASLLAEVLPEIMTMDAAEGAKRLQELRQLTRGALAEMRTLLFELRPNALTDIPLPDLLRQLAEATIGRSRLPVEFNFSGEGRLPADVQVALYRMVQEALNNAVKYARASQAAINLRLSPESARITIVDNGVGFDPDNIPSGHFGLKIMRERAEAVGARVSIYSEPGQGTQITLNWSAPKN
jgi:PAS domain S-box-containing protein